MTIISEIKSAADDAISRPESPNDNSPPLCRELRLALVCYGGVSLAVYMHGITVELQSLVAASAVFCEKRTAKNPFDPDRTEHVYWAALEAMANDKADGGATLRIVLDVIAGTSAGGINGIVLAKALARRVGQDPLRTVWFEKASILKLLARLPWPGRGSDGERSSPWAPLNGKLMSKWAYTALQQMNDCPVVKQASGVAFVPKGNELDLFVTTTDSAGLRRTIDIYDPEAIHDLEYRQVLQFKYDPSLDDGSAFGKDADRMLTLAARSTSSFPGAFPPVTLSEIGAIAGPFSETERKVHFSSYLLEKARPDRAYFVDGGVLNNRPFDHAVHAIMSRTADRQVERRLLFIEPHPVDPVEDSKSWDSEPPPHPSWFKTIGAALGGIPRHQPIADALADLTRHNSRAKEIRQLIALTEPSVFRLISKTAKDPDRSGMDESKLDKLASLTLNEVNQWANGVAEAAREAVGVCYGPYEAIKIGEVMTDLSQGLCSLPGYPVTSRHAEFVGRIVRQWARDRGLMLDDRLGEGKGSQSDDARVKKYEDQHQLRKEFLQKFDMNFRMRRLRFLIRCVNESYVDASSSRDLRQTLDGIKSQLYKLIKTLRQIKSGEWVNHHPVLSAKLRALFDQEPIAEFLARPTKGNDQSLDSRAKLFIDRNDVALSIAFEELGERIKAEIDGFWKQQNADLEKLLMLRAQLPDLLQRMLARYIGFTYWDAILYPLIAMSRVTEPDQVEVIRVSPDDSTLLEPRTAPRRLKGISAFHFGAFLKRSYRENDFLWGRLDAVERVLGMLGGIDRSGLTAEMRTSLTWQGFEAVLDREVPLPDGPRSDGQAVWIKKPSTKQLAARLRLQIKNRPPTTMLVPNPPPAAPAASTL